MTPLHSPRIGFKGLLLQVFAHKRPFSHVYHYLVPGLVFEGKRPSRPPNREILGLSEEVWALTVKCWDGDPSVRPHTTDILSLFETVSRRWVSSTSEAITKLGLNLPTAQKPTMRGSTFTTSGAMWGDDRTRSVGQDIVKNPTKLDDHLRLPTRWSGLSPSRISEQCSGPPS